MVMLLNACLGNNPSLCRLEKRRRGPPSKVALNQGSYVQDTPLFERPSCNVEPYGKTIIVETARHADGRHAR